MGDLVAYVRLVRALHLENARGYHFRCGGEVRLVADNGLVCDGCEAKGEPVPQTDAQGNLIIVNGVISVCFEETASR